MEFSLRLLVLLHVEHLMNSCQALKLDLPAIVELELPRCSPHQRLQQHDTRTCPPETRDGGQDDGLAEDVLAFLDRLAGMEPDADSDGLAEVLSVVSSERLLNGDSALLGQPGAGEGHHEAAALGLDLEPLMGHDLLTDDDVVCSEELPASLSPSRSVRGGEILDVGEHDRYQAVGGGVRLEVRALDLAR